MLKNIVYIIIGIIGFFIVWINVGEAVDRMKESRRDHYRAGIVYSFLYGMASIGMGIGLLSKACKLKVGEFIGMTMSLPFLLFVIGYILYGVFDMVRRVLEKRADGIEELIVWLCLSGTILFLCYHGVMRLLGQ